MSVQLTKNLPKPHVLGPFAAHPNTNHSSTPLRGLTSPSGSSTFTQNQTRANGLLGMLRVQATATEASISSDKQYFEAQLKSWFGQTVQIEHWRILPADTQVLGAEFDRAKGYAEGGFPSFEKGPRRVFRFNKEGYELLGTLLERVKNISPSAMAQWMYSAEAGMQTRWVETTSQERLLQVFYQGALLDYSFVLKPVRVQYTGSPWKEGGEEGGSVRVIFHYVRDELKAGNSGLKGPNLFGAAIYQFSRSIGVVTDPASGRTFSWGKGKIGFYVFVPNEQAGVLIKTGKRWASDERIEFRIRESFSDLVFRFNEGNRIFLTGGKK